MQAFVLGGEPGGTGGTDANNAVVHNDHEQATAAAQFPSVRSVEMAALWLRLRRAITGHTNRTSRHGPEKSLEEDQGGGGGAGGGEGEGYPGVFGLDRAAQVDLSCLGTELFEERDPTASGHVSPAVFREVIH